MPGRRTLSAYEVTSLKIKQLLEQQRFKECEELIKQKPHDYLTACLEKFPFMTMNRMVPDSLPVWEVLLSRLHTREDGYIPQFPYSSCDNLVIQIGRVLRRCDSNPQSTAELRLQCRRVLKKVYMLYEGVLEKACLFHERVSATLCALAKHRPLGLDSGAKSLQETIKSEIDASLQDFQEASQQLQEAMQSELMSLPEILQQGGESEGSNSSSLAELDNKTCSMVQIQERLYFNQTVLRTVQPRKRKGNLSELSEMLLERINGDKDALHMIAQMRLDDPTITADEAVEPHLRDCQDQLDLVISMLKDIEHELQILPSKSPAVLDPSDVHVLTVSCEENTHSKGNGSGVFSDCSDTDGDIELRPRSCSSSHPYRQPLMSEEGSSTPTNMASTRKSSFSVHSADSISSARGGNLVAVRNDVVCDRKRSNTLPSNRASSNPNLLARPHNGMTSGNGSLIAGVRRALFGGMNAADHRSRSTGNIASNTVIINKRPWIRSGSPGSPMLPENGASAVSTSGSKPLHQLHQELEMKRAEVTQLQDVVQHLRLRERELMDRLSEQAQKQLEVSGKFEDISLGSSRPSQIVSRFEELYTQGRMDALDFMENHDIETQYSNKFLLDTLQAAYRTVQQELDLIHRGWKSSIGVSSCQDIAYLQHIHSSISLFLKKTSHRRDLSHLVKVRDIYLLYMCVCSSAQVHVCVLLIPSACVCAPLLKCTCVCAPLLKYMCVCFSFQVHVCVLLYSSVHVCVLLCSNVHIQVCHL
jgi:hypothetical protein